MTKIRRFVQKYLYQQKLKHAFLVTWDEALCKKTNKCQIYFCQNTEKYYINARKGSDHMMSEGNKEKESVSLH